jgi:hypothetical protein
VANASSEGTELLLEALATRISFAHVDYPLPGVTR